MYEKHHQNKPSEHPHLQETLPPGLRVLLKEQGLPLATLMTLTLAAGVVAPSTIYCVTSFEALFAGHEASTGEAWLEAMR